MFGIPTVPPLPLGLLAAHFAGLQAKFCRENLNYNHSNLALLFIKIVGILSGASLPFYLPVQASNLIPQEWC